MVLEGKAAKKGLKVQFTSDKKDQGSGAQCTATCLDKACLTTSGQACVLPFTFDGKTHKYCAEVKDPLDGNGTHWCSTLVS